MPTDSGQAEGRKSGCGSTVEVFEATESGLTHRFAVACDWLNVSPVRQQAYIQIAVQPQLVASTAPSFLSGA
jgi:hypothetical protein